MSNYDDQCAELLNCSHQKPSVSLSSSSLVNDSTANWRGNGSNAAAIVIVGRFVLLWFRPSIYVHTMNLSCFLG